MRRNDARTRSATTVDRDRDGVVAYGTFDALAAVARGAYKAGVISSRREELEPRIARPLRLVRW